MKLCLFLCLILCVCVCGVGGVGVCVCVFWGVWGVCGGVCVCVCVFAFAVHFCLSLIFFLMHLLVCKFKKYFSKTSPYILVPEA